MPELSKGDEIRLRADPERTGYVKSAPYMFGGVLHVRVGMHGESRDYELPVDEVEPIVAPLSGR